MKKLIMSLLAVAMLTSVASAKTEATALKGNASVKTTTHHLANNTLSVIEESKETDGEFVRCNFKVKFFSCDGVLLGSYTYTSYESNCSNFFAAMHDWVANG